MITSKMTREARTTIPQSVRAALKLREGDDLVYHIDGERVILTRAHSGVVEDPFVAFGEWDSEADRKGYADL